MANTTSDKLRASLQSKESIKTAILDMGGTFPTEEHKKKLSAFGDAIRSIPSGGAEIVTDPNTPPPTNVKVGFLRIVKSEMKDSDGNSVKDKDNNQLYKYSLLIWQVDQSYPSGHFVAASGTYDAKDVYFTDNLLSTYAIGNYSLTEGKVTIPAKGKNLEQLFAAIYQKEDAANLRSKYPYVTTNISSTTWVELGSADQSKDVTITFHDGTYKYGPNPPGCSASQYIFGSEGGNSPTKSIAGDFSSKKYTSVSVKADYNGASQSPKSNTGNVYNDQKFTSGTTSAVAVNVYGCYIPLYYGFKNDQSAIANPGNITAAEIKALGNTITGAVAYNGAVAASGAAFLTKLTASASFKQLFYAVPKCFSKALTAIVDKNGLPLTVKSTGDINLQFGNVTQAYKVYYVSLDALYDTLELNLTWQ